MSSHDTLYRPSGGYRGMRSFQTATTIYDATVSFCNRFIPRGSRTCDQMVQAARSGRQNIAEGSRRAGTSLTTEIRLVDVARASLDELLLDYEDFLRHRKLPQWEKDDASANRVRSLFRKQSDQTDQAAQAERFYSNYRHAQDALNALYEPWTNHADAGIVANAIICLIHQANYLLDRQLKQLGKTFVEEGGFSERATRVRAEHRAGNKTKPGEETAPRCPKCGEPMRRRTAGKGKNAGKSFWGCTAYPGCNGTAEISSAA